MQLVWALLVCYLPSPLARRVARVALGWDIHPTAYLGRSVIRVGHVTMGPRTTIGPRNNIRGLSELRMAEDSNIATRNSITAFPKAAELSQDIFPHSPNREPVLILGVGAKVTDNHEIDCSDRVELGRHAALAGFASQILTHSLNLVTDRQTTGAVVLGDHCAVMSGCILQSGTQVPARAIISAGSVVTTRLTTEQALYRGNPAELVRELPDHLAYFHRGEPAADEAAEEPRAVDG